MDRQRRTGTVRHVKGAKLNAMFGKEAEFMPDQKTLLVKLVPEDLPPPPPKATVPAGPSIQQSIGEQGETSLDEGTDPLSNQRDEDLFDYFAASQLAFIDTESLKICPVGEVGRYDILEPSPNGQRLLVTTIER